MIPSACACMFKPEEFDWSMTAKNSLPVNECKWMIPAWNGIPIFLGNNCGLLSDWANKKLITPDIKKESGILSNLKQTSINDVDNMIQLLNEAYRSKNLYIKTDRSERILVAHFSAKYIWTNPVFKVNIEDVGYISEISARRKKWPEQLELTINASKLKGIPIVLATKESSLADIARAEIFPETGEIKLSWALNITENIPALPASQLSLQKVKDFPNFIGRLRHNIIKQNLQLVQGEKTSIISKLSSNNFLYADGSEPDFLSRLRLDDMPSAIEKWMKDHGPPIRLMIGLQLKDKLPESDEPTKVVHIGDNSIILPPTSDITSFDNIMILSYVVNISL